MTDNFNFLGLPLVVQDLITKEIVHNSIPEDRIQLALTSHYCNELVQRARPKKIIDKFWNWYHWEFTFIANSKRYTKTKEELMEILPKCHIKQLELAGASLFEDYSEFSDVLSGAARFATKFDIISTIPVHMDEIVEFYVKLKHLKSVRLKNPAFILPYYPSKVKLDFTYGYPPGNFLEDLAEKSQKCPLAFLELKCSLSLEKCQQFLQTVKFSIGADIRIRSDFARFTVYLIYLGHNTFEFEMFPNNFLRTFINQKFAGGNRRILKLKSAFWHSSEFAFNIVSGSNPEKKYISGVLKNNGEQMFILENVDRDEILVFKFVDESVTKSFLRPIYSAKMLQSAFPAANFKTNLERVEKINNVLGTNIQLIQAENFAQTVRKILKI